MKLYLVRHGESANNALIASTGAEEGRSPDPELTETGHRQAERVAEHLADPAAEHQQHPRAPATAGGFGLTHLYCSLMTRSILTAQYIARACDLPLVAHPEIFEKGGIYQHDHQGRARGLPGPGREYFESRFPDVELPEGLGQAGWYDRPFETEERFLERMTRVIAYVGERHGGSDDAVALVVHGDFIDQFVNEVAGTARAGGNYRSHWEGNWAFHNTSLTRIDFLGEARVVVYTNRLGHLPGELVTW